MRRAKKRPLCQMDMYTFLQDPLLPSYIDDLVKWLKIRIDGFTGSARTRASKQQKKEQLFAVVNT